MVAVPWQQGMDSAEASDIVTKQEARQAPQQRRNTSTNGCTASVTTATHIQSVVIKTFRSLPQHQQRFSSLASKTLIAYT